MPGTLPTDPKAGGPGPAGILAAVVGMVAHLRVLHAGLHFEFVAVEIVVQAGVELLILVAAPGDDLVFVTGKAHTVVVRALEEGVAGNHLQPARELIMRHEHDAPEIALAQIADAAGEVRAESPLAGFIFEVERAGVSMGDNHRSPFVRCLSLNAGPMTRPGLAEGRWRRS